MIGHDVTILEVAGMEYQNRMEPGSGHGQLSAYIDQGLYDPIFSPI